MKPLIVMLAIVTVLASRSEAAVIQIGDIVFAGSFSIDPVGTQHPILPTFTFGLQTVQSATGIFAPYVSVGDTLAMNSPFVGDVNPLMVWTIGGFSIETPSDQVNMVGSTSFGALIFARATLTGNGFDPFDYPFGAFTTWSFMAPPWPNLNVPVTGPIALRLQVQYDDHIIPVPESSTLLLLGSGVAIAIRMKMRLWKML